MCELSTELKTFARLREKLIRDHAGKFVLIQGEGVIGTFDSEEAAVKEGYERYPYGDIPFLVKQVTKRETTLDLNDLRVALVQV